MDGFDWSDLAAYDGEEFDLDPGSGETLRMRLTDVDLSAGREFHTLRAVFVGDPATALDQGVYLARHEKLGEVELFAVPCAPGQLSVTVTWRPPAG